MRGGFFIEFFFILLISIQSFGIEITYFDKQKDLSPTRHGAENKCSKIFSLRMYGSRMATASPDGIRKWDLVFFPETSVDPRIESSIEAIIASWQLSGHYTAKDIHFLKQRERALPRLRTKYFQIKDEDHVAGIRVFDASTQVMNFGLRWFRDSVQTSLSTIEKKYDMIFPERFAGRDSYIWELGLLVSPHHFRGGAPSVMANVAFLLDAHYNRADYRTFGETKSIAALDFQIYGVARAPLVEHYKKYGFEPVWMVNSRGETQPYQFSDGLILIKVSGQRFIELNFDNPHHPATMSGVQAQDIQALRETIDRLRSSNKEVQEIEIPHFPSRENWQAVWNQVMPDLYQKVDGLRPETADWQGAYYDLVRMGYLMLRSPRAAEGDANIEVKRMFFKELLSEGPAAGLQLYKSYILNNKGGREADYDPSFFQFDSF